jgi:hypothetical protein
VHNAIRFSIELRFLPPEGDICENTYLAITPYVFAVKMHLFDLDLIFKVKVWSYFENVYNVI